MKKWLSIALIAVLCLALTACATEETPATTESTTTTTTTTTAANTSPYISEEQAIAAAEAHFGIQNGTVDEKTGYTMAYMVMQTPTEDNPVYIVALRWLVKVDGVPSNWSTLDTVEIEAVPGGIRIQ